MNVGIYCYIRNVTCEFWFSKENFLTKADELRSFQFSSHLSPLTLGVIGAPQMTLQQYLSILLCLPPMSSAKQKLVISGPPMLTLPSWSSKASHMILSRKMLKRVVESRHPCQIPTVVLNHSPELPLNRTALGALSYRFLMARMVLALMLYFLIVAHKALCHTLSKAFLKSMKT